MKFKLIAFLVFGVCFILPPSFLHAEDVDGILFILDASGSMNQQIEGKRKIDIAKEILGPLVEDLPQEVKTGLMVYGHAGSQKGCKNIELIAPLQTNNQATIKEKLASIKAQGKTPIASALEKGAEVIKASKGDKTVVLISDGEETCGGDPVKTAQAIKKELGVRVVIHVIGFDVKGKGQKQLSSIASAGGGNYYPADSVQQLKESLVKIKQEVAEKAIKKRKEFKAGGDIFYDDFEGDTLSENWEVINEDPDNMVLDEGFLMVINQPGSFFNSPKSKKPNIKNLLIYRGELPKNYEVVTAFRVELTDWDSLNEGQQWSGLVLLKDPQNLMSLVTVTDYVTDPPIPWTIQGLFVKFQKGKSTPPVKANLYLFRSLQKPGDVKKTFYFKIRKEKFKYTAFVSKDGKKWLEVGSYTYLGKGLRPGIAAWRGNNATETVTEFDYFRIRELK